LATEIILPKWGLTMEDGTVVAWHKAEGDRVSKDEVIAEVETEKVENELTSPCDGIVARILVAEEETVDVGTVLAIIAADEAEAAVLRAD
jgi:pyruvate/2-oxoglutarate dehydrogenase complex dihydrolipoamide acyltransferase (E2) component